MSALSALILGIVEGITEYLPISSTGHLVLASAVLGYTDDTSRSFDIVIQLGAILAVLVQYRSLLAARAAGLFKRDPLSIRLLLALVLGFIPAAAVGLLAREAIKAHLFGPLPVAGALIVGGVLMIVIERVRAHRHIGGLVGLEHVTPMRGLVIGIGQIFALWPGASRSMSTIVAGQLSGLSTATAAEFSFLLGLPTLGAATLYEGYKARAAFGAPGEGLALVIGLVVSFVVAWAVIAAFIHYLQRRGLEPFGWYRIVLGAVVLWVVMRG